MGKPTDNYKEENQCENALFKKTVPSNFCQKSTLFHILPLYDSRPAQRNEKSAGHLNLTG